MQSPASSTICGMPGARKSAGVDNEKVKRETARYVKLPQIIDFTDKDGNDRMQEEIQANYDRIRQEVRQIVEDEITRIKNDPELCHLIKEEE